MRSAGRPSSLVRGGARGTRVSPVTLGNLGQVPFSARTRAASSLIQEGAGRSLRAQSPRWKAGDAWVLRPASVSPSAALRNS